MSVFSLKGEAYVKSLGGKARLRKKSSISVLPHSRVSPETGIAPSLYPSPSFACPLSAIPQHPLSPSFDSGSTVLPARSKSYGLTSPKTACFPSASSCPHMAGNSQDSPPIGFGGGSDAEPGLSGELGLPSRAGPSGSAEVSDPKRILSYPTPVDKTIKEAMAKKAIKGKQPLFHSRLRRSTRLLPLLCLRWQSDQLRTLSLIRTRDSRARV
eukprot:TRINITY_DN2118_c0_g1_i3.p4 TRINITY_DN2118_c0_g1~~TRINITY_DN2118_c0_g1_i3.p4  ORF type:complete len:212 (+),score=8.00 TRINITY_DN2118_c0_g1_i3:102-737(+)